MRSQSPFIFQKSKCAIALACCGFLIEPLGAQTLNWPYYGNDVSNSRFQDIDQINPTNVSQLKPAWVFHTGVLDPNMSMEMTPIIVDDMMFITTGDDDVFALNPATGKQIWHYHPSDMPPLSTLPICCSNANRGVAVGGGLVFIARLDSALVALNEHTGAVVWKTDVDTPANGASMTLAPQLIGASAGTVPEVLTGVSGSQYGVRGHLDAYSPSTGKLLWRFYTTNPATWAGTSWQRGGAAISGTPTFDPTLNMVYFGTDSAAGTFWGANRAGANLYAASIVALDATTGELQWSFQEAHHDLWNFGGPQPTVLLNWNGIPAIEHTSETGYMWILDRASGLSLFPYDEVAVPRTRTNAEWQTPWPTQPVSSIQSLVKHSATELPAGYTAAPMWTTPGPTPLVFQPLGNEGMEWPPAAYSPRTEMIYSHARYDAVGLTVSEAGVIQLQSAPGVDHGVYGAVNARTGKVAWKIPVITSVPNSGMSVAGDLVFMGDSTGLLYAASAATGEILWVFDASTVPNGGGANASPAVYEINGVEYVVYGFGGNPGSSFVLGDAVIAFALPSALVPAAAERK